MKSNDLILVIDPQKVYLPGAPWGCPRLPEATLNIKKILDAVLTETEAKPEPELEAPEVFLTRFVADPTARRNTWEQYNLENREINEDPVMNELIPEIAAYAENFPYYDKSVYSAFHLRAIRDAAERATKAGGRIVLTGVVAECCVLSTFFEGCDLGHHFLYLTDAVAGVNRASESSVETILQGLSPLHVELMRTEDYLNEC